MFVLWLTIDERLKVLLHILLLILVSVSTKIMAISLVVATLESFRHENDNDDYVDVGDHQIVEEVEG